MLKEAHAVKESDWVEGIEHENLSSTELSQVIDQLKQSPINKKTLGEYRYALKQSELQDREVLLSHKAWTLDHKMEAFKQTKANATLAQLKSKELWPKVYDARNQLANDKKSKGMPELSKEETRDYANQALEPRDLPIKQALEPFVQEKLALYQKQIEALKGYKTSEEASHHFLERYYDAKTPKEAIEKIETKKDILETKQAIQENNLSNKRQNNGALFEHLKDIYKAQDGSEKPTEKLTKNSHPQSQLNPTNEQKGQQKSPSQSKSAKVEWKQSIDQLLQATKGQVMEQQRAQKIMEESDRKDRKKEKEKEQKR